MILLIRHNINTLILAVALIVAGLVIIGQSDVVGAAPVDVLKQCNSQSEVCKGTGENALFGLIQKIINLLLIVIGIIAVIMIIIGGIKYTTSNGDQAQVTSAKNTILYAVVGLVVAIMAYAIVNFVLRALN